MLAIENVRILNRCSGSTGSTARRSTRAKTPTSTHASDTECDDRRRAPSVGRATQAREQHQAGGGEHQDSGSEVVDDVADPAEVARDLDRHHGEGDDTDRDVDVEDPPPGQLLDEDAAEQRPDNAGHAEHRPEQALIAATFTGRDDVPTIAWAPTISPPPPSPWMARKAISSIMVWLSPDRIEPTRKMMIAAWKNTLRPYWSPSLPHSGVETVAASR